MNEKNYLLTQRQYQCAYYVLRGMTQREIAKKLNLSARTVEYYLNITKRKLNVNNKTELIDKFIQHYWPELLLDKYDMYQHKITL